MHFAQARKAMKGKTLLFGTETRCGLQQPWPVAILRSLFWTTHTCGKDRASPFCILNSGLIFGRGKDLVTMWQWMLKEHFVEDQTRYGAYLKAFPDVAAYDDQHEAFGTLLNAGAAYSLKNGRFYNKVTATKPSVVHFPAFLAEYANEYLMQLGYQVVLGGRDWHLGGGNAEGEGGAGREAGEDRESRALLSTSGGWVLTTSNMNLLFAPVIR